MIKTLLAGVSCPLLRTSRAGESVASASRPRLALVIGNGAYQTRPLANPPNDARLIAQKLSQAQFILAGANPGEPVIDVNRRQMKAAVRQFGEALTRMGPRATALFYYAGHAIQTNGKNYLIPIDAEISSDSDLEDEAVSAQSILTRMELITAGCSIVILDACRDSPFRSFSRSGNSAGLAKMDGPPGSIIEFSTAPGKTAEDGRGPNSAFTAALASLILTPNLDVQLLFKQVRRLVVDQTGRKQIPWEENSYIGDFCFLEDISVFLVTEVGPPANVVTPRAFPPPPPRSGGDTTVDRTLMLTINFDPGSHSLHRSSYQVLNNLAAAMLDPQLALYKFEIDGHTDRVGRLGYSLALSQLRADAVANYLVLRGVQSSRLYTQGLGYLVPIDPTHPYSNVNTRVEITSILR